MKLVMATAVFGNYDRLQVPGVVADIPYICLTDGFVKGPPKPWEARIVKSRHANRRMGAYHCKVLVHRYFPDAEVVFWIDANYKLVVDPVAFVEKYLARYNIATFKHFSRDCVYAEARECIRLRRTTPNKEALVRQVNHYRSLGYPEHNGMIEGCVFIRRMTPEVVEFCETWWEEANRFSNRMQLSFNYLCWKLGMEYEAIPIPVYYNAVKQSRHLRRDPGR